MKLLLVSILIIFGFRYISTLSMNATHDNMKFLVRCAYLVISPSHISRHAEIPWFFGM